MSQTTKSPDTLPEAYEALRTGDISRKDARQLFGDEWEDVRQLERVDDIINTQPEPDVDSSELYR